MLSYKYPIFIVFSHFDVVAPNMYDKRIQICIQALSLILLLVGDCYAMTKQQLKKSGKMMKKSCMPKNDVTEDEVGEIENGKFIEEKNVMCYIACIYTMGGVVKNNKIALDLMLKQIDTMFPAEVKDELKAAANSCKDTLKKYKDICESSYFMAKCLYDTAPDAFLFP
uniref:Odorant binding protein n=1 Tax=Dendrolimus kikuchii TaxID=765133 RepID=A0A076E937_9NEOP|nr:odorant binding protein [Dendrolimus kikuchii]